MKLNTRIVSFILVLTMIISNGSIANAKADETFTGKVNMNLSTDGTKILDNLQDAYLNLKDLHRTDNNGIELIGEINYSGISSSVHLTGELKKSKLYKNTLVGNVTDEYDNFDVIHFAVTNNADKSKLLTSKSLENEEVIKIYLMRKDTREFIMFEIPFEKLNVLTKSVMAIDNNEIEFRDNVADDHWWFKVMKPVDMNENKIETRGFTNDTSEYEHTYRYELNFGYYDYYIKLEAFANVYDIIGDQVTDEAGVRVVSEKLTDDMGRILESDESYLQIKNCVGRGELYTNKYNLSIFHDVVTKFDWGHDVTYSVGGLTISPGLWIGKVMGLGVTYNLFTKNVDKNGPQTFSSTDGLKGAEVTFTKALTEIKDSYSLAMTKCRTESSSIDKYAIYDFSFDVYLEDGGKVTSGAVSTSAQYE